MIEPILIIVFLERKILCQALLCDHKWGVLLKTLAKIFLIALFPCAAFAGPEQLADFVGMYQLVSATSNACPAQIRISVTSMTRYATPTRPATTQKWADISFIKIVYDRYRRPVRQPLNIRVTNQTFGSNGTRYNSDGNIFISGIRNFTVNGFIRSNGIIPVQFNYTFNVNGANMRFNFTNLDFSNVSCDYRDGWQR